MQQSNIIPLQILELTLKDISIVHINNQYTKDGELDIHQLFTIESVYDQVLEFLPEIPNEVRRLKNVIESPEVPQIRYWTSLFRSL